MTDTNPALRSPFMPSPARRVALAVASLTVLALAPQAATAASRDDVLSRIPIQVTPDCSIALSAPLDLGGATDTCGMAPVGHTAAAAPVLPAAPSPCGAVVPLVDNRCEAWTTRYDGPAGG